MTLFRKKKINPLRQVFYHSWEDEVSPTLPLPSPFLLADSTGNLHYERSGTTMDSAHPRGQGDHMQSWSSTGNHPILTIRVQPREVSSEKTHEYVYTDMVTCMLPGLPLHADE